MATEFGAQVTEAPATQNFVTPKEGIAVEPHALQGLGQIFDQAGELFKGRKAAKNDLVVSDFVQRQTLVADALAQGKFRGANAVGHARMLTRQNFLQALDANPGLWKELSAAHSTVVGTAGIGAIITSGTTQSQRDEAQAERLVAAHILPADHTDEQREEAALIAQTAAAASERYNEAVRQIDIRLKSNTLTESERKKLETQRQEESRRRLIDMAPAQRATMTTQYDQIINGGGSEAEKIRAINAEYTAFTTGIDALAGDVSAQQSSFLLLPFERTRDAYLQRAAGELEDAELKRIMDRNSTLLQSLILSDPLVANAAAASKVLGDNAVIQLVAQDPATAQAIFNLIAGHGGAEETIDPPTSYTTDQTRNEGFQAYIKSITGNLLSDDPATKEEAETHLNSVLEGLVDDEGKIRRDPKAAFGPVDWIASPDFLESIRANPELFEGHQADLIDVLERNYADEVWGLVQREFNSSSVRTPESLEEVSQGDLEGVVDRLTDPTKLRETPVPGSVTYRTTPSGMEFLSIDPNDPVGVSTAKRLNKTLKPRINKTVQAFSHLNGRSDYGSAWEDVANDVLSGGEGAADLPGGDAGDDLTIDDFTIPQVSTGGLPQEVTSDTEFLGEVDSLAQELEIDPSIILAVMDFETGGSFNPGQKNAAGSSATGLIQFMSNTATSLGTSTEELAGMSRTEQMRFVKDYFRQFGSSIKGGSASDVYMAVLFPKAIGKADSFVLFTEGTKAYTQNKGLDRNGDGTVTKAEASRSVVRLVGKHATS